MADAIVTVTINQGLFGSDAKQKTLDVYGTFDFDGGDYIAGGVPVDFSGFDELKSSSAPIWMEVTSRPAADSGLVYKYVYQFLPGTDLTDGVLQVFICDDGQPLAELGAAAVPAEVQADTIVYRGAFPRL